MIVLTGMKIYEVQNRTFVSMYFRSGIAGSKTRDIDSQLEKIENGLTRKTARTTRASAMDVFRALRHAGSRFRGNCVGKKNREKD